MFLIKYNLNQTAGRHPENSLSCTDVRRDLHVNLYSVKRTKRNDVEARLRANTFLHLLNFIIIIYQSCKNFFCTWRWILWFQNFSHNEFYKFTLFSLFGHVRGIRTCLQPAYGTNPNQADRDWIFVPRLTPWTENSKNPKLMSSWH